MATNIRQRIGISIILVALVVGTIGSFFVMILANENAQKDAVEKQAVYDSYIAKVNAQLDELNKKYYPQVKQYSDRPAKFDRDSVKELETKDLKAGDGAAIDESTSYRAYYIGWLPNGTVFDQSIDGDTLKAPFDPSAGAIEGWSEGVNGMKIGGVRELTIPSDKAYGEAGSGDSIPPNTPLKFIILAIEPPEEVPYPDELLQF
ncbi:hypothetical protein CR983_02225 [Candidatus Saccharibacteria bacterium]|nr:MAG: hypothetical protein CR983_02225 [Candidatus Saccharibacteria bacterium]